MSNTHGMEAFFTREKANEGIELPLYLPSGEKSEHWIRIRGIDSDAFRTAEVESKREAMRVAMAHDEGKEKISTDKIEEIKQRLLSVLVISWSFPQECTPENILKLFKQAPQIADMIDQVSSKRALFFGGVSKPSVDTPNTSSDSTSPQKDQSKVSEQA